jgi:RHS repeat-associated protein
MSPRGAGGLARWFAGRWPARESGGLYPYTQSLAYDHHGNLKTVSGTGAIAIGVDSNTNRLAAWFGAVYDAAGNLTQYGSVTHAWDAAGMVTRTVSGSNTLHFVYTAGDERLATRRSPALTWQWTLRDGGQRVLREYASTGTLGEGSWSWVEDWVYRGSQLLAGAVSDMNIRHYHLDHLGTPRLITGPHGSLIARHAYLPFGGQLSPTTQEHPRREEPMKFTGHERDAVTGLDYMHARYYSGGLGRFLSVDPVLELERATKAPQQWNRYGYVLNNPMRWTDPTGRDVAFDSTFIKRLHEDATFRASFRAWRNSRQGGRQWKRMVNDNDTVYLFAVGSVPAKEHARGATNPLPPSNKSRSNARDVSIRIDPDMVSANVRNVWGESGVRRGIAETLYHESIHALDVGTGVRGREAWSRDEEFRNFRHLGMNALLRELEDWFPSDQEMAR